MRKAAGDGLELLGVRVLWAAPNQPKNINCPRLCRDIYRPWLSCLHFSNPSDFGGRTLNLALMEWTATFIYGILVCVHSTLSKLYSSVAIQQGACGSIGSFSSVIPYCCCKLSPSTSLPVCTYILLLFFFIKRLGRT